MVAEMIVGAKKSPLREVVVICVSRIEVRATHESLKALHVADLTTMNYLVTNGVKSNRALTPGTGSF